MSSSGVEEQTLQEARLTRVVLETLSLHGKAVPVSRRLQPKRGGAVAAAEKAKIALLETFLESLGM